MLRHFPYMFSYDASGLADTSSYDRIGVRTLNGDDFLLRRVSGLSTVLATTGSYNLIKPVEFPLGLRGPIRRQNFQPLIPEVWYPGPDHGIVVTLNNVLRAVNIATYASQLQFQGVLVRESVADYGDGQYWTAPWTYQTTLTLNWTGTADVRPFQLPINDYPFEWLDFRVYQSNGTPYTGADLFAIAFRDATDNLMMDKPVLQRSVNSVGGWFSQWPTIPVIYPVNGNLTYHIQSLMDPTDPTGTYTFYLEFIGRRRVREKAQGR